MNELSVKEVRQKLGISQRELAKLVDVHWRTIQNWEKGGDIPYSSYQKLCAIIDADNTAITIKEHKNAQDSFNIPLVPISAQAGTLNDFEASVGETDCEKIVSPIKGAEYAITISGESMAPEYPAGSIVFVKRINEKAFIDWGKVYVLDTCNGMVVKILTPSDKDGFIKCVSINPEPRYAPFEVDKNDVYRVYKVLLCMSLK